MTGRLQVVTLVLIRLKGSLIPWHRDFVTSFSPDIQRGITAFIDGVKAKTFLTQVLMTE